MKKNLLFVGLFLASTFQFISAQELSMSDATLARFSKFYPESFAAVQWKPNSNQFTQNFEYKELKISSPLNNFKPESLLSFEDLKAACAKASNKNLQNASFDYFPYTYSWLNDQSIAFTYPAKDFTFYFIYDFTSKSILSSISVPKSASEHFPNFNYTKVAYTDGQNVFVIDNSDNITQVSFDSTPGILNGISNVHRQEFGIDKGIWWSPNGEKIAYYHKNETMVAEYPLVNTASRIAEAKPIRYPMAGMTSEQVSLNIYDLSSKNVQKLHVEGPLDQYLTSITWDPNSKDIYVSILNRGQNHLSLQVFDAISGAKKAQLFEEKSSTYVEPQHPLLFIPELKNAFLYQSEKDGFNAFYLITNNGSNSKFLGQKDVELLEFLGYDKKQSSIFYLAADNNGLDRQLYSVSVKNGKTTKHSKRSGVYSFTLNNDCSKAYFKFSNFETPAQSGVLDLKTGKETILLDAENPYNKITMPKIERVTLTAEDGKTALNARIIYPTNFDPAKKYPMVLYVYGGPHAQMIKNGLNYDAPLWDIHMAQQGYIMLTVDNRGSDARGKDFEHIIHRNLGVHEMQDQMTAVNYMKSKSFVDADKIGVYGWSYGGFMTISLLLNYPDVFKVGVSGGPVCDWKYYEVMYGERYMDTPDENPDGYTKTSVIQNADKLNSKLLVIHGAQDDVVVMQHSLEFINACIKKGKQVDYFLYPDHKHNVMGKDRVHLNQKIANYFHDFLRK